MRVTAGPNPRWVSDASTVVDVPVGEHRKTLAEAGQIGAWFRARGYEPLTLADLARSEGVLGVLTRLTVKVEARPTIATFRRSTGRAPGTFTRSSGRAPGGVGPDLRRLIRLRQRLPLLRKRR